MNNEKDLYNKKKYEKIKKKNKKKPERGRSSSLSETRRYFKTPKGVPVGRDRPGFFKAKIFSFVNLFLSILGWV